MDEQIIHNAIAAGARRAFEMIRNIINDNKGQTPDVIIETISKLLDTAIGKEEEGNEEKSSD